jgi:WD40 repeat protein
LPEQFNGTSLVAFSRDGTRMVTTVANSAWVWRAEGSGAPLAHFQHEHNIEEVGFSPDGKLVLTRAGRMRIWNARGRGEPTLLNLPPPLENTPSTFTLDSRQVIFVRGPSPASYSKIGICDIKTNACSLFPDAGFFGRVLTCASQQTFKIVQVSPDGQHLVVACQDEQAQLDSPPLRMARMLRMTRSGSYEWDEPTVVNRFDSAIANATFSPDGRHILIGWQIGGARLFRVDGSEQPMRFAGIQADSYTRFSADGRWLLSVAPRGVIEVLPIDAEPIKDLLWKATAYCLTPEQRQRLLGESSDDARQYHCACENRFQRTPDRCRDN